MIEKIKTLNSEKINKHFNVIFHNVFIVCVFHSTQFYYFMIIFYIV